MPESIGALPSKFPQPQGIVDIAAFRNRLAKNVTHWRKWARRRNIHAFRLYDRDVPQFPFVIDLYEVEGGAALVPHSVPHLHVQEVDTGWEMSDDAHTAWLVAVCDALCELTGVDDRHLHLKRRTRQRGSTQYEKLDTRRDTHVTHEACGERILRFEVNFEDYLDTGLFLDHRQTRARVASAITARRTGTSAAREVRFLNLFAYTGSFTVHAAAAGATHSETVDLSNTYQAWTARNLALNRIDPARHPLTRADVFTWLREADEQGKRFDVIVLDPPSFSNSKKMAGILDVQRDHVWLIKQCMALLHSGGELIFSTNLRSFAMDAQLATRQGLVEITHATVPEDFKRAPHPPHRAWHAKQVE